MSADTGSGERALVLGLDGVPWRLVEEWTDAGELPNFERALSEGAGGPLASTTPPSTPLAWPSIATGVWPDRHGIYSFQSVSPTYSHRINTSRNVGQPALWEILSPSVVGNVPMTYPADGDATMVAGMITPDREEGFTSPPELADEIEERIHEYTIALDWQQYHGREEAFVDDLADLVAARRKLMDLLLERKDWRLFFFVYTAPDRLQHLVWEESILLDHYRLLDSILGDAMEAAEREDATLYVVSDHGFGPVDRLVYVNRLLEREGYLARREDDGARGLLGRLGVDKARVLGVLDRVGIDKRTLVDSVPRSLLDAAAATVPGDHQLYDLDYGETLAFVHGPGNLYVNDDERFAEGAVDRRDVEPIKAELVDVLESVVDPETGERPLVVRDGTDLFPADDYAPDLVVRGRETYTTRTSLTDQVFADSDVLAGDHDPEGLFLAWGPAVEAGSYPANASVVDVAPTVLHGLGEPIPGATDGRVLSEIFAPESAPARLSPTTAEYASGTETGSTDRDFSEVEDRLRGLGYME